MAKTNANEVMINIKKPVIKTAEITIIGDSPLIVHAWGEKAKKEMLAAQQKEKKDKKAKEKRDPFSEFMNALYWITPKPEEDTPEAFNEAIENGAKFGFPITAIKQAALSACYRAGIIPNQTGMKSIFYLNDKMVWILALVLSWQSSTRMNRRDAERIWLRSVA